MSDVDRKRLEKHLFPLVAGSQEGGSYTAGLRVALEAVRMSAGLEEAKYLIEQTIANAEGREKPPA